jgi:hypothetical protein
MLRRSLVGINDSWRDPIRKLVLAVGKQQRSFANTSVAHYHDLNIVLLNNPELWQLIEKFFFDQESRPMVAFIRWNGNILIRGWLAPALSLSTS